MTMNLVLGGTGLKTGTNSSGGEIRKLFYKHRSALTCVSSGSSGYTVTRFHASNPRPLLPRLIRGSSPLPMQYGFTVAYWRASTRRLLGRV